MKKRKSFFALVLAMVLTVSGFGFAETSAYANTLPLSPLTMQNVQGEWAEVAPIDAMQHRLVLVGDRLFFAIYGPYGNGPVANWGFRYFAVENGTIVARENEQHNWAPFWGNIIGIENPGTPNARLVRVIPNSNRRVYYARLGDAATLPSRPIPENLPPTVRIPLSSTPTPTQPSNQQPIATPNQVPQTQQSVTTPYQTLQIQHSNTNAKIEVMRLTVDYLNLHFDALTEIVNHSSLHTGSNNSRVSAAIAISHEIRELNEILIDTLFTELRTMRAAIDSQTFNDFSLSAQFDYASQASDVISAMLASNDANRNMREARNVMNRLEAVLRSLEEQYHQAQQNQQPVATPPQAPSTSPTPPADGYIWHHGIWVQQMLPMPDLTTPDFGTRPSGTDDLLQRESDLEIERINARIRELRSQESALRSRSASSRNSLERLAISNQITEILIELARLQRELIDLSR